MIEQNMPMALGIADYVYVMSKGVIVHECTPGELRGNEEVKAKYIGIAGEKH